MNTIPSTIDESTVPYTVVGGAWPDRHPRWPITVLILNRQGRYHRAQLIEQLLKHDFAEILCVEHGQVSPDLEGQCRTTPGLRFMLIAQACNTGVDINLGIREARSPWVWVLWSDLALQPFIDSKLQAALERGILCTVPMLRNQSGEVVPSLAVPAEEERKLRILALPPNRDHLASLFPHHYVGLYERDRFIQSQGFDPGIDNPFWQKADFGYRAWLWGEAIQCLPELRLQENAEAAAEDTTPDRDYGRFYLKNLLPRFTGDQAELPWSRFWAYRRVSDAGLLADWRAFKAGREWVKRNAYRFRHDARFIAEVWQPGGGV